MIFSLQAKKREAGNAMDVRNAGAIPAVVYGPQIKSQPLTIEYTIFEKMYREGGESSLIDFSVEGEKESYKVLVQAVQYDPVRGNITHADFRQINMNKEMTATLSIKMIGESAAVKGLGGTLTKGPEFLDIRCLPKDLVSSITIDISILKTFEDIIRVKDLVLPTGIMVDANPEMVLAKVAAPLTEEQLKAMEEAGPKDISEVEVVKAKKPEEGEAAEGEDGKDGKKDDAKKDSPKKEEKK